MKVFNLMKYFLAYFMFDAVFYNLNSPGEYIQTPYYFMFCVHLCQGVKETSVFNNIIFLWDFENMDTITRANILIYINHLKPLSIGSIHNYIDSICKC